MNWLSNLLNHRIVQVILALLVVFALLRFLGFTFRAEVGEQGINAGVTSGGTP